MLLRWTDGEPAATERPFGRGCIREVAVPVDPVGDLPLRGSFRGIASSLLAPCGGAPDFRQVASEALPGTFATSRQPERRAVAQRERNDQGRLPLWLAIAAAAALLVEQVSRARRRAPA